jgi:hypothetical protein
VRSLPFCSLPDPFARAHHLSPPPSLPFRSHTPTSLVLYNPPSHALTVLPYPFPSAPSSPRNLVVGGGQEDEDGSTTSREDEDEVDESLCPYCKRPMSDEDSGINPVRSSRRRLSSEVDSFNSDDLAQLTSPPPVSFRQPSSSTADNLFSQPTARYFSILSQANTPISPASRRPLRTGRGSRMVSTLLSGNRPDSPSSDTSAFVDEYESDEFLRPTGSSERSRSGRRREREDADGASSGADGYYDRFFKEEGRLGMGAQGTVFLWCVI